jgi:two-component system sensor histidine kinase MtrB
MRAIIRFALRSLWLRVVVATLLLSGLVMAVLGFALQSQITDRLLDNKLDAAIAEVDAARVAAQTSLEGAEVDPSQVQRKLVLALEQIADPARSTEAASQGSNAGVFEPVLISARPLLADRISAGPAENVPAELRERIGEGQLASQYTTVVRSGVRVPALVVGAPVVTRSDNYELYLIYRLSGEQQTLDLIRKILLVAGLVLAALLAGIAALVANQVVRPVRRASAAAKRLAGGALDERMTVSGPVELAQLSRSFNGMAAAIKAQIRQLEEFGQLQRRFTSDVSHELRTPLTTVRMAADLLHADREELPPHLARSTELMVNELDRFEDLLADLLEISRFDAGMADLSAESIDLRSPLRTCLMAVAGIAAAAGVTIETRIPDEPVRAEVDSRRIERILRNLLANAVDHAEGKPVVVEMAADTYAVAITVSDTGVGLKSGEAGLVFNRFWRADPSRQRQTGGTGLGLAIALEDARLHGGWLEAWGKPGIGARFRLTLPRTRLLPLVGSPLPLDPEEAENDGAGKQPVVVVAPTPTSESYFTTAALSTLSIGFHTGATENPDVPEESEAPQ